MLERNGDQEVLKKIEENRSKKNLEAHEEYMKWLMEHNPTYAFKVKTGQVDPMAVFKQNRVNMEPISYEDYMNSIKPVPNTGPNSTFNTPVNNGNREIHIKTDPQDIKLNGTLNLRGQDGKSIDIIDTLSKDKVLLTSLSSMVSNEIKRMGHGSDVSRDF
jgi:hypothetical protein